MKVARLSSSWRCPAHRIAALLALLTASGLAACQSLPNAPAPQTQDAVTLRNSPHNILEDQKAIWTSPAHIRVHDLVWLVPLAGAESAAIATDHQAMHSLVSRNPSFNQDNVNASNVAIGTFIALPVGIYSYGHFEQDSHAREAGILGGEAILDGVVVEQGLKLIFWRERPGLDQARGHFFQSGAGIDSSFPSSHCVLAWSEAAALAGEYHSLWQRVALYGVATGIALTRVMGQQHFPGDVLAGSAAGWLVGHYVFQFHHQRDVAAP